MAPPVFFFFFQAEDGIRDYKVTGVQTWLFRSCGLWSGLIAHTSYFAQSLQDDGVCWVDGQRGGKIFHGLVKAAGQSVALSRICIGANQLGAKPCRVRGVRHILRSIVYGFFKSGQGLIETASGLRFFAPLRCSARPL